MRPKQPFYFLKPPSSIVLPGAGPVIQPKGVDLHYEVELGLIMGKKLRDFPASDEKGAIDAVECEQPRALGEPGCTVTNRSRSAYVLAIDMTARNAQNEAKKKGLPWDISKGFDTFLPVSHVLPKSAIPDPHDIELFLQVNGETHQDASTNLMLFQIPRLLSDISKVMTLEPGDLVLTGTPAGVGPVVPGDVMRAGLRVNGKELEDARIEIPVEKSTSSYEFSET